MESSYYVRSRGQVSGPYTANELGTLLRRGLYSRIDQFSRDGVNWCGIDILTNLPPSGPVYGHGPLPNPAELVAAPPRVAAGFDQRYFYAHDGTTYGPVPVSLLRVLLNSGHLLPEDVVWEPDSPYRQSAHQVLAAGQPPPAPPPAAEAPLDYRTEVPSNLGDDSAGKAVVHNARTPASGQWIAIAAVVGAVVFGLVCLMVSMNQNESKQTVQVVSAPTTIPIIPPVPPPPPQQPQPPTTNQVEPPEPSKPEKSTPVIPPPPPPPPPPVIPAPVISPHPPLALRPPAMPPQNGVSDEQIGEWIKSGVDALIGQVGNNAIAAAGAGDDSRATGTDALCVYALLQAGQSIKDARLAPTSKFVKEMLDKLKKSNANGQCQTYTCGLRIAALTVLNRQEDQACIKDDANTLMLTVDHGGYTYQRIVSRNNNMPSNTPPGPFDNSNSQYGLLGVWLAAEDDDIEVPDGYWQQVQAHWEDTQLADGAWDYTGAGARARQLPRMSGAAGIAGAGVASDETLSMTCAGIASLFVCHDWLDPAHFNSNKVGREPLSPQLAQGLSWLETGNNCVTLTGMVYEGYTLYSLERVGLASGFKYFGKHDWYRELAAHAAAGVAPNGAVVGGRRLVFPGAMAGADPIPTAYCLLFLARGRHPILMNKLRFDGDWANRPRDVANLARFASHALERPFNWQVNSIDHEWTDWMDSPVLYLASHQTLKLTDAQVDNLRQYVLNGGLLFTQADGNSAEFNKFAADLAKKLFPQYALKDVPPDSSLYKEPLPVKSRPALKMLSNGARILMLHSPIDISQAWEMRSEKTRTDLFQLGANIAMTAAGYDEPNNRLATLVIPEPPPTTDTLQVARVKYAGDWDPEPAAWPRFARWFAWQTGVGLNTTGVEAAALNPRDYPIAHLTGCVEPSPTDQQLKALQNYVHAGGILIIDACGGSIDFGQSIHDVWLPKLFPNTDSRILDLRAPILLGNFNGGQAIAHFSVRPAVLQHYKDGSPKPVLYQYGAGYCVFSQLDITTGLLGTKTATILGYDPTVAQGFLRNTILWCYANAGTK